MHTVTSINHELQLRSLAFGGSGSGNKTGSHKQHNNSSNTGDKKENKQYEQWKEHDSEIVDDMFEKELQQAILASKVEHERKVSL